MVLGPLQFVRSIRVRRPGVHRWIGRVFLVSGLIVGVTALVLGPQVAIGGANETAATLLFGSLFLFALIKAWLSIRRRKVAQHREWMIRAFAIGLAVATIRPIVGIFFATSASHTPDATRIFRDGVLARLYDPVDRSGNLDRLHEAGDAGSEGVRGAARANCP